MRRPWNSIVIMVGSVIVISNVLIGGLTIRTHRHTSSLIAGSATTAGRDAGASVRTLCGVAPV